MSVRSIAKQLGVSSTAVSLALKDSPRVSPDLRAKVQKIAQAMGYIPNARLAELMTEVRNSKETKFHGTLAAFSLYAAEQPWRAMPLLEPFLRGATARAANHGYNLEYFWMKQPGMTIARFRGILETRGIQGLLCLGSQDPEEPFPPELRGFAVTTFAASIPSKLHRVVSHFAADARTLYGELIARGYERPGLIIVPHGDRRTEFCYSSVLLGWQERRMFRAPHVPVFRPDEWNALEFEAWFGQHRPDVIVLHHMPNYTAAMEAHLTQHKVRVPADVGIALLDMTPDPSHFSGIRQNFALMGATAVEMLIGRVLLRDFAEPGHPKIELVLGEWNEGQTLKPRRRRADP